MMLLVARAAGDDVALAASLVRAIRAARADPATTVREDG
jgi:hypothetical protein